MRSRLHLLIAYTGALLCGACLPIPHEVTLAPAVEGTYRHEDGTPVAGAPLALSRVYGDSTCASPAHRTTTDVAGRFAFPETSQREPYIILLPVDRLLQYTVCGGEPAPGTLYTTNYLNIVPDSVAITCTQLAVAEPLTGKRTSCTGRRTSRY